MVAGEMRNDRFVQITPNRQKKVCHQNPVASHLVVLQKILFEARAQVQLIATVRVPILTGGHSVVTAPISTDRRILAPGEWARGAEIAILGLFRMNYHEEDRPPGWQSFLPSPQRSNFVTEMARSSKSVCSRRSRSRFSCVSSRCETCSIARARARAFAHTRW